MSVTYTEVLVTPFDVLHARGGSPIICRDTDGDAVLLQYGNTIFPSSLAQRRALEEQLPILVLTDLDIELVIRGKSAVVRSNTECAYAVRVPTAEELVAQVERAGDELEAQGLPRGPGITLEKARELTRTLP